MLRERPFASHVNVQAWVEPLDRYSFPSGHTLHAALFLTMLAHYFPVIALIILPFGLSVAASRVILGLHYPSDVVIGALMGWTLACLSLAVLQV
jgi:undecaprenyl-diphosphatase